MMVVVLTGTMTCIHIGETDAQHAKIMDKNQKVTVLPGDEKDKFLLKFVCYEEIGECHVSPGIEKMWLEQDAKFAIIIEKEYDECE